MNIPFYKLIKDSKQNILFSIYLLGVTREYHNLSFRIFENILFVIVLAVGMTII